MINCYKHVHLKSLQNIKKKLFHCEKEILGYTGVNRIPLHLQTKSLTCTLTSVRYTETSACLYEDQNYDESLIAKFVTSTNHKVGPSTRHGAQSGGQMENNRNTL